MSNRWPDIAYPWGPDITKYTIPKGDAEVLKTSVINILLTARGERVMRPEFGSLIPSSVFEQNDDTLISTIGSSIQEAIERWDDRIAFLDYRGERDENTLRIHVMIQNATDPNANQETITFSFANESVEIL